MNKTWQRAWLAQFAAMLAACLICELSYYVSDILRAVLSWAAIPVLGACTAYRCVMRGLNNYAAWIAPPVCTVASALIVWGYVPHAGPVLVCAFVSLVGAAAGEVAQLDKQKKNKR